jgi:hypothetical protein
LAFGFSSDLVRRLVYAEPDINRVPQKVVGRSGQVGDLGHKLWLDPMDARDFLVELRGFEPLISAVSHPPPPVQPLRFHAAIR